MDGQETLTVEQSETLQQLQKHTGDDSLPTGTQEPVATEAAPAETPTEIPTPEADPASTEAFEYDGQTFANEREAFEYMKGRVGQLETERLLDEARMEGRQEALQYIPQGQAIPPQVPEPEEDVDMEKFYENPSQFLKDYGKKIYDKVANDLSAKQQAQMQEQQAWNDFTNKYPDLTDFRGDVNDVLTQHNDTIKALASRNKEKAMEFVATKTREKFQRYIEAMKPTRTLSNSKSGPSVGSNTGVTPKPNNQENSKPLDFASQLRQRKYR